MLLGGTIHLSRRSGVHRVVIETARALASRAEIGFVTYDALEGGLRFLDVGETNALFGAGDWPPGVKVDPSARRTGQPFRNNKGDGAGAWLFVPEVVWHDVHGAENLARIISQCRVWNVRTACIFYDLIPIQNPIYMGGAPEHAVYVAEIVRCDLVIPISNDSGAKLLEYWRQQSITNPPVISSLLLPDGGRDDNRPQLAMDPRRGPVVLLGTVEPRKRQLEFLEAYALARRRSRNAAELGVLIIGSLHPYVADKFNVFLARNPWVSYIDYASDDLVQDALRRAPFSAFVSDDEGYGLPISESLAAGTPVLCADFGAMAEIAAGGGCQTVDVANIQAIEQAIVDLLEIPDRLSNLRKAISRRNFISWKNYADSLIKKTVDFDRYNTLPDTNVKGPDASADEIAQADILVFENPAEIEAFLTNGSLDQIPSLLPPRLLLRNEVEFQAQVLQNARLTRGRVAGQELAFRKARSAYFYEKPFRSILLRILISTFNRRDFVVANVRWLLHRVMIGFGSELELVVVDGNSNDGTVEALRDINDPRLRIVESATNVGMLAAWREAARLQGAEYVWVIGDDDFISRDGLLEVVEVLKVQAGVPFVFVNFSVYNRTKWTANDRPTDAISESVPMAENPVPSGLYSIARTAEQHDNLFTAIYAIIWRADVLSATYDHAFDGAPFSNLIEAIPCTESILRVYGACEAWWIEKPAIAGNAHNSWSRHRPLWHGVVIPAALMLAREIGVNPQRLQRWADDHLRLYNEAVVIANNNGEGHALSQAALRKARIVFRTKLAPDSVQ